MRSSVGLGSMYVCVQNDIINFWETLKSYLEYEKALWTVKLGHFGGNGAVDFWDVRSLQIQQSEQ